MIPIEARDHRVINEPLSTTASAMPYREYRRLTIRSNDMIKAIPVRTFRGVCIMGSWLKYCHLMVCINSEMRC